MSVRWERGHGKTNFGIPSAGLCGKADPAPHAARTADTRGWTEAVVSTALGDQRVAVGCWPNGPYIAGPAGTAVPPHDANTTGARANTVPQMPQMEMSTEHPIFDRARAACGGAERVPPESMLYSKDEADEKLKEYYGTFQPRTETALSPDGAMFVGTDMKWHQMDSGPDWKFCEGALLDEFARYLRNTYSCHYCQKDAPQVFESIVAAGHGMGFAIGGVVKYLLRYGHKDGKNRKDLMKALHLCLWTLYCHDRDAGIEAKTKAPVEKPHPTPEEWGEVVDKFVAERKAVIETVLEASVDWNRAFKDSAADIPSAWVAQYDREIEAAAMKPACSQAESVVMETVRVLDNPDFAKWRTGRTPSRGEAITATMNLLDKVDNNSLRGAGPRNYDCNPRTAAVERAKLLREESDGLPSEEPQAYEEYMNVSSYPQPELQEPRRAPGGYRGTQYRDAKEID